MLELTSLHLKQIVGESEEPEACIAQLAQRRRNLGVWRHRGKLVRKLFPVLVIDLDAACIRQHFHYCGADIGERDVAAGHGQGRGIHDEVGEPQAHGALFAEDPPESRLHCFKIENRLVDIEDDQGKSGHIVGLLFVAPGLEFVGLSMLLPEPIAVRGLFGAIAADRHAAPSSCPPPGTVGEHQRATMSLARFHVGEIFLVIASAASFAAPCGSHRCGEAAISD